MDKTYQYDFSSKMPSMFDVASREQKAKTMVATLFDFFGPRKPLETQSVLDVGSSTGIIDHYLADHFKSVIGIDIDSAAVRHAGSTFSKSNLEFLEADAMHLEFADNSFDVVICSQVYEHVPDSTKLIDEIFRVLKPSGVCYFSAGNRVNVVEPHYRLPFLSILPKQLAHLYMKITGKGSHYYEEHLTYWSLKRLTKAFVCHDYTQKMVADPVKYQMEYMLKPTSIQSRLAKLCVSYFYWAFPNYIWLLEKPIVMPVQNV
jgi:ubiquinone/menaquinone biosynthesis C-methylase UbiE